MICPNLKNTIEKSWLRFISHWRHFQKWPPRFMRDSDFKQYLSLQGSWNPSFGVYTHVYNAWEPNKHECMYIHGFVQVWAMILKKK